MSAFDHNKTLFNSKTSSRLCKPPAKPRLAAQKHTAIILQDKDFSSPEQIADGLFTSEPDVVLAIRTADCVPVMMADPNHHGIAHAGWRGTKAGIVTNLLNCFPNPADVHVHIGPAICGKCFEVGPDVYADWQAREPSRITANLHPSPNGGDRRLLDLRGYIKHLLIDSGVPEQHISIAPECTFEDPNLPSYRRDQTTQRLWHTIGPRQHSL